MSKKQIIQITISIICLGGAVLIMYGQLFKNSAVRQESSTATESGAVEILPNGETLDFSKAIFKDRFKYNQVQYPKLNPGSDVGIPKPSLIVP